MNQLIKQLAQQATVPNDPYYRGDQDTILDTQKFAELIIRECAQQAALMRHVYPHQAELTATTILDHFGVQP